MFHNFQYRVRRRLKWYWYLLSAMQWLPNTKFGDYLWILQKFLKDQRRLPKKKSMLLNDVLFRMLSSEEITQPLRILISDKELSKEYVASKVGSVFNVPTIAVLRSFNECRTFLFPDRCVIKPTHASGQIIRRMHGEPIDYEKIKNWFRINHYHKARERNYKDLMPKVIVEPFVFENDSPIDYKMFCWQGQPRLIQLHLDRFGNHEIASFTPDWQRLSFSIYHPKSEKNIDEPKSLPLMLDLASKLSSDFTFVRVDLYSDGKKIFVGELTNCPDAANNIFIPRSAETEASAIIFGFKPTI
jgi:TupA-like ATPgrasp